MLDGPFIPQCKLGIVKFIEAKQVPEVETVVHLVMASSDTRHSVATAADLELKSKQRYGAKIPGFHSCLHRSCLHQHPG